MKRKLFLAMFALVCFVWQAAANNIQVTNATLTGQINGSHTFVEFDLNWENSWRYTAGPRNFDAAYVIVKYRVTTAGPWMHATIASSGHNTGTGPNVPMTILPTTTGNGGSADYDGVYIYRTGAGTGNITMPNVQLRWNYPTNGVADGAAVQIRVYAIEMVYIPQGPFYIGDGSNILVPSSNGFRANNASAPNTNYLPWKVTSESAITYGSTSYTGTNSVSDPIYSSGYTLVSNYPKGYNAFWVMKYEVSQKQYMDFFNTLPYEITPRSNRNLGLNGSSRNMLYWNGQPLSDMVLNGTSSGDRACNYMCWSDACAFADWACMRPMTELEFEKACRGTDLTNTGNPIAIFPVNQEYAWGSTSINPTATVSNDNTASEGYTSCVTANCHYSASPYSGPMRCGIFAAKNCGTDKRRNAGATYYGVMEMSGNLAEMVITPFATPYPSTSTSYYCNRSNHPFTTQNGDGIINSNGNANGCPGWAHTYYSGSSNAPCYSSSYYPSDITINWHGGWVGLRGGSYNSGASGCRVSDRSNVHLTGMYQYGRSRQVYQGFRAVRSAPNGL